MKAIETVEAADLKKLPQLTPGDTVRVHVKVKETSVKEEKGKSKETERERVQVFEGTVIRVRKSAVDASITVRRISHQPSTPLPAPSRPRSTRTTSPTSQGYCAMRARYLMK